jgi:hypothetical protein
MTVPVGSSYSTLKAAIVDQLRVRPGLSAVSVSYQAPLQPPDVQGPTGSAEAIWLDDAEGEHDNVVVCSLPLQLEELYAIRVIIQVLRPTSLGTQEEADRRVDELAYEVLHELAHDPTWGLSGTGAFNYLHTTRSTFRRVTGYLPNGSGHAARYELSLQVDSRISFG